MSNTPTETKSSGYGQILSSSLLTGGAQIVTMLAAFVRMKVAAVTIGTAGVGMLGLLTQSTGLVAAIAGLGLSNSGVREVAAAAGSGDAAKRARVIRSLRVLTWITGLLGALICVLFAGPLSRTTFGDESHRTGFMVLGAALFMTELATGQSALLRGLGRIRELAIQSVVISLVSTVVTGTCYYVWGLDGIVPSLVALALLTLAGSWWYARKVEVLQVSLSPFELWHEAKGMLRMGLAFVWSSSVNMGMTYVVAVMVRDHLGLEGNGFYMAAWGMSGLFVGLVLTAMGQDFYPRLTGMIHKPVEACRLINEQTEIGILLALPGVVATVSLAGWLVPLLYSAAFLPAVGAVAWFCLGCFWRITSFPLGYTLIAKGESFWFALTETAFCALNVGLAWLGLKYGGLAGVALGFAAMYLSYTVIMRVIVGRLLGFSYSQPAWVLAVVGSALVIAAAFIGPWLGLILTAGCAVFCLRGVLHRLGPDNRLVLKLMRLPGVNRLTPRPNRD